MLTHATLSPQRTAQHSAVQLHILYTLTVLQQRNEEHMTGKVKVVLHYDNEQVKYAIINKANELGYTWIESEGKLSVITPDENSAYIALVKAKQHAHK